jgi:hypothetical protein
MKNGLRAAIVVGGFLPFLLAADGEPVLIIKDHRFVPEVLKVPANQKLRIIVENQDPTPEEFESHSLDREKLIAGNSKATLVVGPLDPGGYPFFGEFHEETARGTLVAE